MSHSLKRLTLVAAVAANGVIGADGGIPWHLPGDFAHFKALTMGHILVMGRATYESIGRPLPGRTAIVLTRDRGWAAPGVLVAHDLDEALALADGLPGEVHVVGGARIYQLALPYADAQVITEVHLSPEGDTHYPEWDRTQWTQTRREPHDGFDIVWWTRSRPGIGRQLLRGEPLT